MYITGNSTSRLNELQKFTHSEIFTEKYFGDGSVISDGVDYSISSENQVIVYYLNGIRYVDKIYSSGITTTYGVTGQGYTSPDFINSYVVKLSTKDNIISNSKINNDVFIDRQQISVFDRNYRLEFIRKLVDLETYASGKYFNIVKNS